LIIKTSSYVINREAIDWYPVRRFPVMKFRFKSLTGPNGIMLAYHRAALGLLPVTESFVLPPDSGAAL
jgi:hypothetical protein